MSHRGPDGRGVYDDDSVFLGHRRLAIIDLSEGGRQPMKNNHGKQFIIFNGEIYNYLELRDYLIEQGIDFETESDTEVLLKLVRYNGAAELSKLIGMFAFAVWDADKEELLVARDRYGIKPLYYYDDKDLIVFSSEIKSILAIMEKHRPNDAIIYDFLHKARVDFFDETFFKDIFRMPAGSYAIVTKKEWQIHKWYDLADDVNILQSSSEFRDRTETEHIAEVKKRFKRSLELRLRSDVPVGSCLSGGIDSSSIVSVVSTMLDDPSSGIFQTYSAVYGDWFPLDESRYINEVLNKFSLRGNFISPTVEDWERFFPEFLYYQEEPVISTSPLSQYFVMKLAHSKGAKVLLDGQGADEILAGYDYMIGYYIAELLKKGKIATFFREVLIQMKRNNTIGLKTALAFFIPIFLRKTVTTKAHALLDSNFTSKFKDQRKFELNLYDPPHLNQNLFNHVVHKLQHLLRWEDRNSMAHSVETRVPFLDHNLVTYILALPPKYKIRNGVTKWVLRKALGDLLPKLIVERTDKIGFATPEKLWLAQSDMKLIRDLQLKPHPSLANYINMDLLKRLLEKELYSELDDATQKLLFRIICLQNWLNLFFGDSLPTGPPAS